MENFFNELPNYALDIALLVVCVGVGVSLIGPLGAILGVLVAVLLNG